MSKIQEALDKIRAGDAARQVGQIHDAAASGNAADATQQGSLTSKPPSAVTEIAQMQEHGLRTQQELADLCIISGDVCEDRLLNSLRELRTSIFQRLEPGKRIIMITSVADGGGTSFVARNLAAAIALDEGKTALIIDCNLKRPNVSRLADCKRNPGLRGFLKDTTINPEDIICRTGVPRLRIIPAGDELEGVHEYFTSLRLKQLLIELERRYPERYIILDAPSIADDADARILVDVSDYAALVVPYGRATIPQVIQSAKQIGKDKFLGLIFNNEPVQGGFSR